MLLPSRPAAARQSQSECAGGCPVSRFAFALVMNPLRHPQLNERQLAGQSLLAPRAGWPRWSHRPNHPFSLQLHVVFGHEGDRELFLGGDPFPDALIDLSQRGRHNALARLRLFALGSHASPAIKRILGLLRRDPKLGIDAVPALEHCHLA